MSRFIEDAYSEAQSRMGANLPKPHLPGKGVVRPLPGEGGRPFEPGQVREIQFSVGDVGASTNVHARR